MLTPRLDALTDRYMGKGPTPVLAEASLMAERWLPWLTKLFTEPDSHWFDLGAGERRDDVIRLALQKSVKELSRRLGPEPKRWSWGRLHQVTFQHVLGAQPTLATVFNLGPFPIGGDHTTLWATGASYHNLDTSSMIGPPYRMIVDLGNLDASIR
jgi:penicillin amidase